MDAHGREGAGVDDQICQAVAADDQAAAATPRELQLRQRIMRKQNLHLWAPLQSNARICALVSLRDAGSLSGT